MKFKIHLKILVGPARFSLDEIINFTKTVFEMKNITINIASIEQLNLPLLQDVEVGNCRTGEPTQEMNDLFNHRNNIVENEVVVYIVRTTVPPFNGCSAFPSGKPGCVITRNCGKWTLPHELGHVLSLRHTFADTRLMYGFGTDNIISNPPELIDTEVGQMQATGLILGGDEI